jgi:hypothetical protein
MKMYPEFKEERTDERRKESKHSEMTMIMIMICDSLGEIRSKLLAGGWS